MKEKEKKAGKKMEVEEQKRRRATREEGMEQKERRREREGRREKRKRKIVGSKDNKCVLCHQIALTNERGGVSSWTANSGEGGTIVTGT